MMNQTKTNELIAAHRDYVETWRELSNFAAAGFPKPLTEQERDVYMLLPFVQDQCKAAYAAIPAEAESRPLHYLMTT